MRLQNKLFTFKPKIGEDVKSTLLTSNVLIDGKLTDILLSDLFFGIKKTRNNTIRGFSILEFANERNEIEINERVYKISFIGKDDEKFSLAQMRDPIDFVLNDKEISDSESSELEKLIQESAPAKEQEQPLEPETLTEFTARNEAGANLFDNDYYKQELEELQQDGFVEYNTDPRSNMRLLVDERGVEDNILIEIEKDDFAILINEEYETTRDLENKTFTYNKKTQNA